MKTIHPKNVSNEDLVNALVSNLRRDPSKDVSIITDELLSRLAAQQSVQSDGACACGSKDWFHYEGDEQWYCSQCKSPRR